MLARQWFLVDVWSQFSSSFSKVNYEHDPFIDHDNYHNTHTAKIYTFSCQNIF